MNTLYVVIHPGHITEGAHIQQTQATTSICDVVENVVLLFCRECTVHAMGVGASYWELNFPAW